jgi:hypothetical protein
VLLEAVMLVGTIAADPKCVAVLAKSKLVQQTVEVVKGAGAGVCAFRSCC